MLTLGRVVRSALVAGAVGVLPLSTAAAGPTFESTANSCTGGSLNICLGFDLFQIGHSSSQSYSLALILNAINGGASSGGFGSSGFGLFGEGGGRFTGTNPCAGGVCGEWNFGGHGDNDGGDKDHDGLTFLSTDTHTGDGDGVITTTNPEPASLLLVGTGLVGLVGFGAGRRRRRRA